MLAVLVVAAIVAAAVAVAVPAMARQRRFSEVDRFHRARAMTTAWARAGVTSPVPPSGETQETDERVSNRKVS